MGYVGNQQSEGFSSIPAKQDFTGATGTSLTLTHAVASAEGIDLYINNVRQEPTEAYSVVGTAVTLTGSVVASDDIYVVYNSLARQTSTHPSNQALQATSGAFSGDLTVDTTTLKVDSTNNRVGIGTASPSSFYSLANNLVVGTGSGGNGMTIYSGSGDSGYIGFNDTASASMQGFIQYNHNGDYMAFAPNGSEKVRIDSSGNLLVGGTAAASATSTETCTISSGGTISTSRLATAGRSHHIFYNANGFVGQILTSGTSTSYSTSSDYRLKENVTYDWDATTRLKQLKPARFNFNADADTTVDGFLAHEVQDIVPESISGTKDAVDEDGNPEYQSIDQSKLTPLLTKALIEAVEKIETLEARITALEAS